MNSSVKNQNLVVSDPEFLSGEPVFAGTRITIGTVLASIDAGIDLARIRASYPIVDDEHIAAARAYRAAPATRMFQARVSTIIAGQVPRTARQLKSSIDPAGWTK